jgi:uncharacterized protein YaiI (UPF0178 family)
MADGKFNRCILPHGQFQSGLSAGKSIMRMKAMDAFRRYIDETYKDNPLSEEERKALLDRFEKMLTV